LASASVMAKSILRFANIDFFCYGIEESL